MGLFVVHLFKNRVGNVPDTHEHDHDERKACKNDWKDSTSHLDIQNILAAWSGAKYISLSTSVWCSIFEPSLNVVSFVSSLRVHPAKKSPKPTTTEKTPSPIKTAYERNIRHLLIFFSLANKLLNVKSMLKFKKSRSFVLKYFVYRLERPIISLKLFSSFDLRGLLKNLKELGSTFEVVKNKLY